MIELAQTKQGGDEMRRCPHCGEVNVLREIPIGKFFQYYRCRECNRSFREFDMPEFRGRMMRSTGYWYITFAAIFLISLLAIVRY